MGWCGAGRGPAARGVLVRTFPHRPVYAFGLLWYWAFYNFRVLLGSSLVQNALVSYSCVFLVDRSMIRALILSTCDLGMFEQRHRPWQSTGIQVWRAVALGDHAQNTIVAINAES